MSNIEFSDFGKKLTGESGILQLMDDIGKPLPAGVKPYRLGGGNPARIPQVEKLYRARMEKIMGHKDDFESSSAFTTVRRAVLSSSNAWPNTCQRLTAGKSDRRMSRSQTEAKAPSFTSSIF